MNCNGPRQALKVELYSNVFTQPLKGLLMLIGWIWKKGEKKESSLAVCRFAPGMRDCWNHCLRLFFMLVFFILSSSTTSGVAALCVMNLSCLLTVGKKEHVFSLSRTLSLTLIKPSVATCALRDPPITQQNKYVFSHRRREHIDLDSGPWGYCKTWFASNVFWNMFLNRRL